jgi:hypothetical protein
MNYRLPRNHSGGHIVTTGLMSADTFEEYAAAYVAAKAGVRGRDAATRPLVLELGEKLRHFR